MRAWSALARYLLLDTDIYEPLLLRNFDAARIVADDELVPLRNAWLPAQNWSLEGSFSAVKLDELGKLSASAHREPHLPDLASQPLAPAG